MDVPPLVDDHAMIRQKLRTTLEHYAESRPNIFCPITLRFFVLTPSVLFL
ncbi:MAG: hypothetical protein OJF47_003707 [Nitrospira sp.]|nr:MAG: hypothetical protein OJF47_003707 [Nitrospira sp.]